MTGGKKIKIQEIYPIPKILEEAHSIKYSIDFLNVSTITKDRNRSRAAVTNPTALAQDQSYGNKTYLGPVANRDSDAILSGTIIAYSAIQ